MGDTQLLIYPDGRAASGYANPVLANCHMQHTSRSQLGQAAGTASPCCLGGPQPGAPLGSMMLLQYIGKGRQ